MTRFADGTLKGDRSPTGSSHTGDGSFNGYRSPTSSSSSTDFSYSDNDTEMTTVSNSTGEFDTDGFDDDDGYYVESDAESVADVDPDGDPGNPFRHRPGRSCPCCRWLRSTELARSGLVSYALLSQARRDTLDPTDDENLIDYYTNYFVRGRP